MSNQIRLPGEPYPLIIIVKQTASHCIVNSYSVCNFSSTSVSVFLFQNCCLQVSPTPPWIDTTATAAVAPGSGRPQRRPWLSAWSPFRLCTGLGGDSSEPRPYQGTYRTHQQNRWEGRAGSSSLRDRARRRQTFIFTSPPQEAGDSTTLVSVEIWSTATIGDYLWTHILEGDAWPQGDSQLRVGVKVLDGLNFTFHSGCVGSSMYCPLHSAWSQQGRSTARRDGFRLRPSTQSRGGTGRGPTGAPAGARGLDRATGGGGRLPRSHWQPVQDSHPSPDDLWKNPCKELTNRCGVKGRRDAGDGGGGAQRRAGRRRLVGGEAPRRRLVAAGAAAGVASSRPGRPRRPAPPPKRLAQVAPDRPGAHFPPPTLLCCCC